MDRHYIRRCVAVRQCIAPSRSSPQQRRRLLHISHLGIHTEKLHPFGLARERMVIGMDAVHPSRGVDTAIEAVASIPPGQRPPLHWIANFADSSYHQKLSALAKSPGWSSLLHRWRFSDENIIELLHRASVMVYSARLEPFGLAPLEANACAAPVVAVTEGGMRESIRNGVNGVLISERRPEQMGKSSSASWRTRRTRGTFPLASRHGLARDPSRRQAG